MYGIMTSRSCFIPSTRYQHHHNCVTVYLSRLYQFHKGTAEHIKYRNTDSCLNGSVVLSSMYCRTNNYLRAMRSLKSSFTRSISTASSLENERSSPYIHIPVMSLNNMKAIIQKYSTSTDVPKDEESCSKIGRQTIDELTDTEIQGRFQIIFTCKVCDTKNAKEFSKQAYYHGVVIVRCSGCQNLHLISDNLKWFGEDKRNIETILAEKGELVLKENNDIEITPKELTGTLLNDKNVLGE